MPISFFGPNATKATTMQELYKDLTVTKEGAFEVDFPAAPEEMAAAYEATRVTLLTLFRNGLKALNARDGQSIMREFYPTPTVASPFFDEEDLNQVLAYANSLLNPRDPYFPMAVADGEVGAIRILGDIINMVNRYGDARTAFVLLRMFVRPIKEQDGKEQKTLAEFPFDERKKTLLRRRNSILAVGFRADNNFLVPDLIKSFKNAEDQKLLTGAVNAFDQNATRLNLTELQRTRWLYVLLNNINEVIEKGVTPTIQEGLTSLVIAFNSAQKPEEIAVKIDGFVDSINPLPKEGAQETEAQQEA